MSHRIPNDEARVNVNVNDDDDEELAYWCDQLATDVDTLREAVSAVGVEVGNVRMHLSQAG